MITPKLNTFGLLVLLSFLGSVFTTDTIPLGKYHPTAKDLFVNPYLEDNGKLVLQGGITLKSPKLCPGVYDQGRSR
jgi:hypothetical protein